ncbi:hypothetical protein BDB01DRAFT_851079 [Pilobolus umbonatus]|nr:hypothetical protein BDB01DRAFT_851079 [Pilobolus umbonatus]
MDDWALRDPTNSSVGVNGFVDNMQLLWKLQSFDPIITTEDNTSPPSFDFNQSTSTTMPDEQEDLVDKLFRENIAMHPDIPHTSTHDTSNILSLTPDTGLIHSPIREDTPLMKRKRSRSPEMLFIPDRLPDPSFPLTYSSPANPPYFSPVQLNHSLPIPLQVDNIIRPIIHNNTTNTNIATSLMLTPPNRPQLRLHLSKHMDIVFDDTKDPMKPDLDVNNLRKLTIATLRTLGVYIALDELPPVDINEPLSTDSQQVLPTAAMQLITTMVLGTSGDKEVSQTLGSQISNGDLVALQRMIVAGLRSKNIVIHTVLTDQPSTAVKEEPVMNVISQSNTHYNMIDLSQVKYEPPHNVTRLFLRLYRFMINMLLSTPDCWPFIQPVPDSAFLYHQEIKHPMDLQTIELNVWKGKYTKFARFEKDMQLIWKNARVFHRNTGTIYKHAENLEKLFTKIVMDIKRQIRKQQQPLGPHDFKFDPANTLPEESDFSYPPIEQVFSEQSSLISNTFKISTVYTIAALSPLEPKGRKPKGLTQEKLLYLQLNGPFFQAVERMKTDLTGNHSLVPRFYIAKNRTLLRQIRSQGVLAIFYNTKTNRRPNKLIKIETDMILAYPASELFDIDQINECTDDFAPKGWIHLRPLRVVRQIVFEVNEAIERDYFKRMFATSKMAIDDRTGHHNSNTKRLLKKIVRQILGLPISVEIKEEPLPHLSRLKQRMTKEEEAMDVNEGSDDENINEATPKEEDLIKCEVEQEKVDTPFISSTERLGKREISHDIWKKLFKVCSDKGILINNIAHHGHINWNSPNSEGFFKRVYFFDNIVVQAFRQMTMYQRITEVACLMKLRNLPHMAQMKEVLYNDNGDVAGLSMERYQITLKQYTHVHSHHRLTAYQKFDVIHQMLICMKTIHEAGLAHRDLSEVNIMVNTVEGHYLEDGSEKVCLYLIDFGKSVFCEPQDVRDWFVDVPRADWEYDGDVVPETKEELNSWCELLPWVKGKPDHGYRISIQTLPKTRSDNQILPWLIHPQAEDMYSIGVMIWKVFTDTEPWRGILDTDLQGLRYVAEDDYRIQRALEGEVHGELSRQLLLKCLKTRPQDRATASEILNWIEQPSVQEGLIGEWKMYSSDTRGARRAKTLYGFEDTDEEEKKKPKKRTPYGSNKIRGRTKSHKDMT